MGVQSHVSSSLRSAGPHVRGTPSLRLGGCSPVVRAPAPMRRSPTSLCASAPSRRRAHHAPMAGRIAQGPAAEGKWPWLPVQGRSVRSRNLLVLGFPWSGCARWGRRYRGWERVRGLRETMPRSVIAPLRQRAGRSLLLGAHFGARIKPKSAPVGARARFGVWGLGREWT